MKHSSTERREAVTQKMMSTINIAIAALAAETGINPSTLYNWRKRAKNRGVAVPGDGKMLSAGRQPIYLRWCWSPHR